MGLARSTFYDVAPLPLEPGGGPGAMLAFSAATLPAVKSLRHGEPYPRVRQTPPRFRGWSNQPASAARRAPGPPRRDPVNRQEPKGRRVPHRSP